MTITEKREELRAELASIEEEALDAWTPGALRELRIRREAARAALAFLNWAPVPAQLAYLDV